MRRRGHTLIATVATIAIMGILAVALMRPWAVGGTAKPARADGKGNTV
ncbi:type II secretion system protein, partial [bacterium]